MATNARKMILRFDRKENEFTITSSPSTRADNETSNIGRRNTPDLITLLDLAQGPNHGYRPDSFRGGGFSDLNGYLSVNSNHSSVKLSKITVYHSRLFCMGIEATYRIPVYDGHSQNLVGAVQFSYKNNVNNSGYYAYHGGQMTTSELIFDEDEYLCEVRTRQGEITDQITLCTNKRVATFGGMGGNADPRDGLPVDLTKRVVAFVGSFDGVLHRLGTVSVNHNWEIIREFILLRSLVESKRASFKEIQLSKEDVALHDLMKFEVNMFRRILSFLLSGVETDQR
jgi:hypothetical protein